MKSTNTPPESVKRWPLCRVHDYAEPAKILVTFPVTP
jgi:hypothetical protein